MSKLKLASLILVTAIVFYGLGIYAGQKSTPNSIGEMISTSYINPAPDVDLNKVGQLVNDERAKYDLPALTRDGQLDLAAQNKCNDMVAKDYWSHNAPDGTTPFNFITQAGISYDAAGENLAYGFTDTDSVVTGWMNSEGHKKNILSTSYTNVGYAQCKYSKGSKEGYRTLVVQMFIKPYSLN